MEGKYTKLILCFKIPDEVSNEAISISSELGSKYKVKSVLDGIDYYPHITIYAPQYPEGNLSKIIEQVDNVVIDFNSVNMKFVGVKTKNGYVAVNFELNSSIKGLHQKIIKALSPLREGYINEKYSLLEYMKRYNEKEIKNIKEYGYPFVLDSYYPHLTLARLEDESKASLVTKKIKWSIEEFKVNKLALHKAGKNGVASEIIKEFDLQG